MIVRIAGQLTGLVHERLVQRRLEVESRRILETSSVTKKFSAAWSVLASYRW